MFRYMEDFAPAPSFLPVTVNVYIESKDVTFRNIVLKNTDSVRNLKILIKELFEKRNDPLVRYSKNNIFVLRK